MEGKLLVLPLRLGHTWHEKSLVRLETPMVGQVGLTAEAGSEQHTKLAMLQCFHQYSNASFVSSPGRLDLFVKSRSLSSAGEYQPGPFVSS